MAIGYRGDARLRARDRLWVDLTHASDKDEHAADSADNGDGLIQQRLPRACCLIPDQLAGLPPGCLHRFHIYMPTYSGHMSG